VTKMLISCVPAQLKCQSKHLGHSCSEQYVQMDFRDEKRRWLGFEFKLLFFGVYLIHLHGCTVACVS